MSVKRNAAVSVGGSSILVVFILLCLTTFATLSLVSANADKKLTDKTAQAVEEYYTADAKAEEILSVIDGCLFMAMTGASSKEDYLETAGPLISSINKPVAIDGDLISYSVPINENQELQVVLRVLYGSDTGKLFERVGWKSVNTSEWEPEDESFVLWDGGMSIGG